MKKLILLAMFIIYVLQSLYAQEEIIPVESSGTFLGAKAKGFMTIRYCSINPGDDNLRRPLIVAEGFDPGHLIIPEVETGYYDVDDFLADATNDGSSLNAVLNQFNPSFYDIIFIDWKKGTDYIRRNALLVEEVIRYVNAHKVAVNGIKEQNVVIGLSMGGLCARWALREMEDNAEDHETRLFVTWDSPHQGANVPEGYQRLARHARDFYVLTGGTAVAAETVSMFFGTTPLRQLNLASMPACREMLVNYVSDIGTIDNSVHDAWQADLRAKGYPQGFGGNPLRVVAVSNGSECAKPQDFSPGDNLLTFQGEAMTINAIGEMASTIAVPAIGAMITNPAVNMLGFLPGRSQFSGEIIVNAKAAVGTGNQVYKGTISYKKKIFNLINVNVPVTNRNQNANASTLPYDYYPGGFYDIRDLDFDLESSSGPSDWTAFFWKYNTTVQSIPTFCFVPVASALDIGSGNATLTNTDYLTPYSGANPPTGTKASPFPNFITAFQGNPDNEEHIDIHTRNGNWLANELSATTPNTPDNCSFACPGAGINGDNSFCTTSPNNYNISNLPATATVTWSATPSGIVTVNCPSCTQTTLSRISDGTVTLTAIVSNTSCGTSINLQRTGIRVGPPPAPGPITFLLIDLATGKIQAQIADVEGASSYNWFINGTLHPTHHGTFAQIPISKFNCDIDYDISVEAVNDCGASSRTHANAWVPCDNLMMISPNPSSGEVTINADASKTVGNETAYFDNVKLFDMQGNLKKAWKFNKVQRGNINISMFNSGQYYLEISCGHYKERKLLLLQK